MESVPLARRGHRVFYWLGLTTVLWGCLTVWAVARSHEDSDKAAHSHRILTALATLKSSVSQAESSVRAYFLNDDLSYLRDFERLRPLAEQHAADLKDLLADNADQSLQIEPLVNIVRRRMQFLVEVTNDRQSGMTLSAIQQQRSKEGRNLILEINQLTSSLATQEEKNLAERTSARNQAEILVLALCGVGLITSISLVWVGQKAIVTYRNMRDRTQESLEDLNRDLERRVSERTMELERSQAELSSLAQALGHSNQELEKFAYAASHDLQEPIRNIRLFAELLRKRWGSTLEPGALMHVETIITASTRMRDLVQGLLEYSRLNLDTAAAREPVDLDEVVMVVLQNLSAQMEESRAEIIYAELPELNGNRLDLIRVMQNLVGNGIKYQSKERHPEIRVSAERDGQFWKISVADNGIGFEPQYNEYVFGMLKRLDTSYPGAGFGLAICKMIVEKAGGRIWAEGRPGLGATFYFLWPV